MAVNNVTVINGESVDDEVKLNQLSDDTVNGFDLSTNGDDIHKQYLGSPSCDKTKIAKKVRFGQSAFLSSVIGAGNFAGGVEFSSKTTTGISLKFYYYTDNGGGNIDENSSTTSLTWNGDGFSGTGYHVVIGLVENAAATDIAIMAIGVE